MLNCTLIVQVPREDAHSCCIHDSGHLYRVPSVETVNFAHFKLFCAISDCTLPAMNTAELVALHRYSLCMNYARGSGHKTSTSRSRAVGEGRKLPSSDIVTHDVSAHNSRIGRGLALYPL